MSHRNDDDDDDDDENIGHVVAKMGSLCPQYERLLRDDDEEDDEMFWETEPELQLAPLEIYVLKVEPLFPWAKQIITQKWCDKLLRLLSFHIVRWRPINRSILPYKARLNAVANHIKLPVRIRFLSTVLQLLFYHLTKNARNQLREYKKKTREQKKLIVRRLAHKRQQRMVPDFTQNSKRISTLFPRDSSKSEGDEREEEVEKAHTMNLTGASPSTLEARGWLSFHPAGFTNSTPPPLCFRSPHQN